MTEHAGFFLAAAREIARRLVRDAVWHDDRCTWLGDDIEGEGEVVHRSFGGDLYGGTSGIGWFLANLHAATGDDNAAQAARGALRHALHRSADSAGVSLYSGRAGIALASVLAGRLVADDEIVKAGARLAAEVVGTPDGRETDLIGGAAGTVLARLELAQALDDGELLDSARSLGEDLVRSAHRTPTGWTWPPADGSEPALCGLGHGASGIALALLALEAATGDERFREAAEGALLYERCWFSREHGNWPDLRELRWDRVDAGVGPGYPVFWCHGAAGIGLARLHAYRYTGDTTLLAEAAAAIDVSTAMMLRLVVSEDGRPRGADLSLCHGVGSVAELHVTAAEVTGDSEHLRHARRLLESAFVGRALGHAGDNGALRLPEELPCGVPGGGETPGLMLGLAGIGALLLRLHDSVAIASPALIVGWAASEGRNRRVAPDLDHERLALELGHHSVV